MDESFEERLAAVERALTDTDGDRPELANAAEVTQRVDDLEADLAALTDRVAELEAATQALRGYVGNVRSVNEEVEQRADLALSKAEAANRAVADSSTDRQRQSREDGTAETGAASAAGAPPVSTGSDGSESSSPASVGTGRGFAPSVPHESMTDGTAFPDRDAEADPAALADDSGNPAASGTESSGMGAEGDESGVLARIRALV